MIGESEIIKKTLDLCLMSILSDYVETGSPQIVYSLKDFGNNINKDLETFESIPEEIVRDYVEVSEQKYGVSFDAVLSDLEYLRELRKREKSLRSFLKGLILHLSGGVHEIAPKKNIDIGASVSDLWKEIKSILS